ncbi:hypothetical protein SAMN04488093_102634 [Tropicibacter naphthalenivorans]|uniref:Uncharacterized protein n=2 Tax=Tropicibacter naphthalenivorans TaxID=441103 RepID=A0A0P1GMH2_9RHOB|nr:hypothetical protein TRN7648_00984 [Tropicibacter naphthalenivorans]SMC65543.1 hypothetical protein SAMN04488093_102634 [Tropicibacter naphthalenivorans]
MLTSLGASYAFNSFVVAERTPHKKAASQMDVILHVGAHRTGSTSFQHYMRANRATLDGAGIGFWGPWRTRKGVLDGLTDTPATPAEARRRAGRVQMNLRSAEKRGLGALVVSDENLIGTPRRCVRAGALYPEIGLRMARVAAGFAPVTRVNLQIRSLDMWWASALAFLVPRGMPLPTEAKLEALANASRSWRHVITDLACACPGADITVTVFERFADRPEALFEAITGQSGPESQPGAFWANRCPDLAALRTCLAERGEDPAQLPGEGRWQPFDFTQAARLREAYADDLFWLRAGADGLATLTETAASDRPGTNLGKDLQARGQRHDRPARRLAPTR